MPGRKFKTVKTLWFDEEGYWMEDRPDDFCGIKTIRKGSIFVEVSREDAESISWGEPFDPNGVHLKATGYGLYIEFDNEQELKDYAALEEIKEAK